MIFDLHNDYPTALDKSKFDGYVSTNDGVTIVAAVFTAEFDRAVAADKVKDLRAALRGVPTAIEDMGFVTDEKTLSDFDFGGLLYCSLTWNYNNAFAGGALDDGTLTPLGRRAIELMNGRCAVDLAHLNKKSFYAALDTAARPICSHTAFGEHPRCLDDAQIRALTARRGLIGLCAVRSFTGAETADALCAVADTFVQRYGADCLCLGTDFNGTADLPEDLRDYCDIPRLIDGFIKRGYASADINKILYDNAKQLYEETIRERHL